MPIAGMGTTRINAAFNSGPDLLVKTVEQDLGIDVNHFVVVNFDTFTQIADSIGGVYQYFPAPARDLYSGLTVLHPGCVLLKGGAALSFVRSPSTSTTLTVPGSTSSRQRATWPGYNASRTS